MKASRPHGGFALDPASYGRISSNEIFPLRTKFCLDVENEVGRKLSI